MDRYTYLRIHTKLLPRERGQAADHQCVDCGGPARDWSQVHGTTGLDLQQDYVARCRPCHKRYDHTPEISAKLSAASAGKPKGEQHRRHISAANTRRGSGKIMAATTNTMRRTCECGVESTPAGISSHQRVTGHKERT